MKAQSIEITNDQLGRFSKTGFLVVEGMIGGTLLEDLRAATDRVIEKTLAGQWPHRRNWPFYAFKGKNDFWGVSHLLHPDLNEISFASYLAGAGMLPVVERLLGQALKRPAQGLQLELVNLLNNPLLIDFEIPWHRDNIRSDVDPAEELKLLDQPDYSLRWNCALYPEDCLRIVPGSHLRAKTPAERDVFARKQLVPLDGELAVALEPGDTVFYNVNLLHRGVYPRALKRRTLHCCMGEAVFTADRVELFSSLEWMAASGMPNLPPELQPCYSNFLTAFEQYLDFKNQRN